MTRVFEKILYAEDEPDIREIATMSLEAMGGFVVETCSSGDQVVAAALRFIPDLVLLDVMMPGMDGPSALKALHATPGLENIPVVFMTAKVMKDEVQKFKDLGAVDVITKPFDPMTLSDQIKEIWTRASE